MAKTCKAERCNKARWGGGYCNLPQHQKMRTDRPYLVAREREAAKTVKVYLIPKVSENLKKDLVKYKTLRIEFLTANSRCQYPDCRSLATDVHHDKGRGIYLLRVDTWVALCRPHHQEVEMNPEKAKDMKLSRSRLAKEE